MIIKIRRLSRKLGSVGFSNIHFYWRLNIFLSVWHDIRRMWGRYRFYWSKLMLTADVWENWRGEIFIWGHRFYVITRLESLGLPSFLHYIKNIHVDDLILRYDLILKRKNKIKYNCKRAVYFFLNTVWRSRVSLQMSNLHLINRLRRSVETRLISGIT